MSFKEYPHGVFFSRVLSEVELTDRAVLFLQLSEQMAGLRPLTLCWESTSLGDDPESIHVICSSEWSMALSQEFDPHAPYRPNVNLSGVATISKEKLRRPVPPRDDICSEREVLAWVDKLCKAKISQFDISSR